jgi:sulfite reductase beta subunit-like hemoprotein
VGGELTLEEGRRAARLTGLSILATLEQELGDLDRVVRIVKVFGMVNAAPGFTETPAVIVAVDCSSISACASATASTAPAARQSAGVLSSDQGIVIIGHHGPSEPSAGRP